MNEHVVGIDIGGTKLATVVADSTGHILGKVRKPTLAEKGPEYALGLLFDMVRETVQSSRLGTGGYFSNRRELRRSVGHKDWNRLFASKFARMGRTTA